MALIGAAALFVGACAKREDASARNDSAAEQPMAKMDSGATAGSSAAAASGPAAANAGMKGVLDQLASLNGKPIETLTPAEARKQPSPKDAVVKLLMAQGKPTDPTQLVPGVTTADRTIPGPGGALPVRIYTPEGNGPFPVIVYYHGGGWVIANKDVYDPGARALSKDAGAVVVSVDYRLAPEHKFPAQHDDALATYEWTMKNAASIKGDPNRIALAGESAGGNLAVATAMLARDKGDKLPVAIASVYPIAQPDTNTASYVENATAKPLGRAGMGWFFKQTVRTPADLTDPRIDLVHANLKGLPPVAIVNAQIDPLRDDGAMLEQSLKRAGVSVDRKVYDGVAHEFFGMGAVLDEAKDANQWAADHLKSAFGKK
ncbi:MAG TPA: alpha/beta hydrolase [Gemmatimonadaceae bacterium]|nr:alpha/beta hydrolase [Gemmatimonadaceae bacterium]